MIPTAYGSAEFELRQRRRVGLAGRLPIGPTFPGLPRAKMLVKKSSSALVREEVDGSTGTQSLGNHGGIFRPIGMNRLANALEVHKVESRHPPSADDTGSRHVSILR